MALMPLSDKIIAREFLVLLVGKFGVEALWDEQPIPAPRHLLVAIPVLGIESSLDEFSAQHIEPAARRMARRLKRARLKVIPGLSLPHEADGTMERYAGVETRTVKFYRLLQDDIVLQVDLLAA